MSLIMRLLRALLSAMRSRAALAAEILILRQQLNVVGRTAPRRVRLTNLDRLLFVWAYRLFPSPH